MKNTTRTRTHLSIAVVAAVAINLIGCADDVGARPVDDAADVGDVATDASVEIDLTPSDSDADDSADDPVSDAPERCEDDELEPTTFGRPYDIEGSEVIDSLAICPFDSDWYRIPISAGDRLDVSVRFVHSEGDLDIVLWSEFLQVLGSSETSDDMERVVYGAVEDETVLLGVFGFDNASNDYRLTAIITPFNDGCDEDPEEPNDSTGDAVEIESPYELTSRVCDGDVDWFQVSLPAQTVLSARLDLDHLSGDLELRAYDATALDEPIVESATEGDVERILAGPFESETDLLIEVAGHRGAFNDYRLRVNTYGTPSISVTATGLFEYEDRRFDSEGFTGEIDERPARQVGVELVREFDGVVLGESLTDDTGAYSIAADVHADEPYYLRAVSALSDDGFRARVEDRSRLNALYALASESFQLDSSQSSSQSIDIDLLASADSPTGGSFNILDASLDAFRFLKTYADPVDEVLTYRWEPGRAFICGSCYMDSVISLGGQLEDTDEYDDDIILHELGHFFQDHYSATSSPGGSHDGQRTNPLLAFGEGGATFFSSLVQGDPEYVDTYIDSVKLRNLETAVEDEEDYFGTADGTLSGDVSEFLVAAIMWDSVDPASDDEPFDDLELDISDVMTVFMETLTSADRPEIGIGGIDLADWLNGVSCLLPESALALAQLCTDDRQFPWNPGEDSVCTEKARSGRSIDVQWRDGALWLNGPVSPLSNDHLYLDVRRGARRERVSAACDGWPCQLSLGSEVDDAVIVTGQLGESAVRGSWLGPLARERLLGRRRVGYSPRGVVREFGGF